jgi:hypothetical protein
MHYNARLSLTRMAALPSPGLAIARAGGLQIPKMKTTPACVADPARTSDQMKRACRKRIGLQRISLPFPPVKALEFGLGLDLTRQEEAHLGGRFGLGPAEVEVVLYSRCSIRSAPSPSSEGQSVPFSQPSSFQSASFVHSSLHSTSASLLSASCRCS